MWPHEYRAQNLGHRIRRGGLYSYTPDSLADLRFRVS